MDSKIIDINKVTAAKSGGIFITEQERKNITQVSVYQLARLPRVLLELDELRGRLAKLERKFKITLLGLGLIAIVMLIATVARADTLSIAHADGPYSLDAAQRMVVTQGAINLMAKAGISVSIDKEYNTPNYRYKYNTLIARLFYFRKWIRYFRTNRPYRNKALILFAPPIPGPGGYYTAGYAQRCPLELPRIAMVNAIAARVSDGAPRLKHATVALAHELGHLFGARHDHQGFNMMHPTAIALYDQHGHYPNFAPKALRQFRSCKVRRKQYLAGGR